MRLVEAIVDANRRALSGDADACVHVGDFSSSLPIVALTCIDPRLNSHFPGVLGIPESEFIWLRNAGNIIFEPMSSMVRSIALACAIKGGREIAVIGHTDCKARQITVQELMERFKLLGVERSSIPENINEFFGLFASERQNVIKGVDLVRRSPLIGAKIPVHGLLVDTNSGALEWISNGYEAIQNGEVQPAANPTVVELLGRSLELKAPEWKFPEVKIGEMSMRESVSAAAETVAVAREKAGEIAGKVEEIIETGRRAVEEIKNAPLFRRPRAAPPPTPRKY